MKPHKHAEIIKVWADGSVIEFRVHDADSWSTVNEPSWFVHYQYRIKPEPRPDFKAAFKVSKESPGWCSPQFEHMPICTQGNLLLTFDGETGELKAAEVLK